MSALWLSHGKLAPEDVFLFSLIEASVAMHDTQHKQLLRPMLGDLLHFVRVMKKSVCKSKTIELEFDILGYRKHNLMVKNEWHQ